MSAPTSTYALIKDVYYHTGFYKLSFWLRAGEQCEYFAHSDTYLLEARSGVVPFFHRKDVESRTELFRPHLERRRKRYGLRMAKPTQENFDTLLKFLQGLDEKVNDGEDQEDVGQWVIDKFYGVGLCYERVLWAYKTLEENAVDPDLDYLDWKPEIKAALEQAGFEVYAK